MKKIEFILILISSIAIYGNYNILKGSNLTLIIALSLLATVYSFSAMNGFADKLSSKSSITDQKTAFTFKLGGFSMAMISIGILFYILIWPGHKMMLIMGTSSCLLMFLLALSTLKKVKKELKNQMLIRLFVWVVIGGIFLIFPQKEWISKKFSEHPSIIKKYENFQEDPSNDSLRHIFHESIKEIK